MMILIRAFWSLKTEIHHPALISLILLLSNHVPPLPVLVARKYQFQNDHWSHFDLEPKSIHTLQAIWSFNWNATRDRPINHNIHFWGLIIIPILYLSFHLRLHSVNIIPWSVAIVQAKRITSIEHDYCNGSSKMWHPKCKQRCSMFLLHENHHSNRKIKITTDL